MKLFKIVVVLAVAVAIANAKVAKKKSSEDSDSDESKSNESNSKEYKKPKESKSNESNSKESKSNESNSKESIEKESQETSMEFSDDNSTLLPTAESVSEGVSSALPENPSTEAPKQPEEGDACDHAVCQNTGYCQSYLRCDKEKGQLVKEHCGEGLVWNPLNANGSQQIHGGNCDTWENLSADVERAYRSDEECLACFWRALGDCEREYDYQPVNQRHRNVIRLSCAEGLVFSQEKETCQRCQDVQHANGTACCVE